MAFVMCTFSKREKQKCHFTKDIFDETLKKNINFIKPSLLNIKAVLLLTSNIKSNPFSTILCNEMESMEKSLLILIKLQ